MKVCYLNCVRILCKFGANPNCSTKSDLTPLQVLMHTGTENISMARVEEKTEAFEFIRNLLTLLLQHGLDPNVRFSQRSHHILLSLMDMVQNSRCPKDLNFVYSLTLTLLQYGANPNMVAGTGGSGRSRGQTAYEQSRSAGERRRGRQENVFIRRQTNNQVNTSLLYVNETHGSLQLSQGSLCPTQYQ